MSFDAKAKMEKTLEGIKNEMNTIRTGRASASLLERVQVEYYGSMMPINQLARIQVLEGTQLVVKPYDRSITKAIGHAIAAANLGLNPLTEADLVRINVPQLTQERREQLAKEAQKYGEEAKVAIRNIRRDANDALKKLIKANEITEDEQEEGEEEIQKMTDKYIGQIDKDVEAKTKEIMTV